MDTDGIARHRQLREMRRRMVHVRLRGQRGWREVHKAMAPAATGALRGIRTGGRRHRISPRDRKRPAEYVFSRTSSRSEAQSVRVEKHRR